MEQIFNYKSLYSFFLVFFMSIGITLAQTSVVDQVGKAMKAHDASSITSLMASKVKINIKNQKGEYDQKGAEAILNNFFKNYPPSSFQYLHKGNDSSVQAYTIGRYKSDKGSFRVYVLIKDGKIDTLDFKEEG
ncbi:DUF4783 domain-containing protein [Sediminitomix flava]|uniref:Uncharacterized protein DUF4783 n=1 Tax=Sediminitomix flava TaxID=379075 RepID=A0A315ZTV7_SEDFL|nr:DUF4783 domain-containing protein [Sediminitomix flava]PWJ39109.1 uncharacterized protein DUF4783 [Sediminitomix flava]